MAALADETKDAEEQLARVAILNFVNNTNSAQYEWASKSFPDAINKSMQQNFEYIRTPQATAQQVADKFRGGKATYNLDDLAKIAKEAKSEIIIFGDYVYDKKKGQLRFRARVFHIDGNRFIGNVKETSPIDNRVFTKVDVIAKKIVDQIYRYALAVDEEEAKKAREKKEKLRLLVLVPSWKTKKDKKRAIRELDILRFQLSKKYSARYITIFQFYDEKNVSKKQRKKVNKMAKARNEAGIIKWLNGQGVQNAFIVLVNKKKVNILPVVDGKKKARAVYRSDSSAKQKAAALKTMAKKAGIKPAEKKKTVIRKSKGPGFFTLKRLHLAASTQLHRPLGTANSDQLPMNFLFAGQVQYRIFNLSAFQVSASLDMGLNRKINDGDKSNKGEDARVFDLNILQALGGVDFGYPMPFHKQLEVHFRLGSGIGYSILTKEDDSKAYSADLAVKADVEFRYYIWGGFNASLVTGYQRVFYLGTDISDLLFGGAVGYSF